MEGEKKFNHRSLSAMKGAYRKPAGFTMSPWAPPQAGNRCFFGGGLACFNVGTLEGVIHEVSQADVRFAKLFERGESLDFGLQVHPVSFLWLGFSVRGASRGGSLFGYADTRIFSRFSFPPQ